MESRIRSVPETSSVRRVPALIGAWVTLSVVYTIAGFSFGHLFANEGSASDPLVLPIVGFAISNALLVLFFSWVADQMGHAVKAALTVAISQLLLVNVDYVLGGSRGITAGIVSSIVLLVAWGSVGVVYQTLLMRGSSGAADAQPII